SYHLCKKVISRAAGRSGVAAAAYRARTKLHDEKQGMSFDYSRKHDLAHSEILLPPGAPERLADRNTLWNEVEKSENRKDSRLAREIEVALPQELNIEQQIELVREYAKNNFVDMGMIADINIHASEKNPHAHIMLTTREVGPDGFGKKTREWDKKAYLLEWRKSWADIQNQKLYEAGYSVQVDHRSFAAIGIDLEPQIKLGMAAKYLPVGHTHLVDTRDLDRLEEYQRICRENGERIIEDPDRALKQRTYNHAIFTELDLAKYAFDHSADADQFTKVETSIRNSLGIEYLGRDESGQKIYTSKKLVELERESLSIARNLNEQDHHNVHEKYIKQAISTKSLSEEQTKAVQHITHGKDVSILVGRAGSGKSYTLGAIREVYGAQGYRVRGVALAGIAAEGLQNDSGIHSKTLHRQMWDWDQGRDLLSNNDIIVLDEAAMVGTRQMHQLLTHVKDAGAKIIMVGDQDQAQSIEAGGIFRAAKQSLGAVKLTQIRRQKEVWQKEATLEFAGDGIEVSRGIELYHQHGHVKDFEKRDAAKEELVKDWAEYNHAAQRGRSIILAYTNKDVEDLNAMAREQRKLHGELNKNEVIFATDRGKKAFVQGDRILFLKNERSMGVRNGTVGTIESIGKTLKLSLKDGGPRFDPSIVVKLDSGDRIAFDASMYTNFDHGYAMTVHKAQGSTLDRVFVLASPNFDRHMAYVAMTRHRDDATVYYGKDDFPNLESLKATISRDRSKILALEYENNHAHAFLAIGHYESVFSDKDLYAYAREKKLDEVQLETLLNSPELVALGRDHAGNNVYTSRSNFEKEQVVMAYGGVLKDRGGHGVEERNVSEVVERKGLSEEQEKAFRQTLIAGDLAVIVGRAGSGKSYTLGA
ncbi:MAG: Ti-type conjugative transfer relaxase TraA, partial [Methanothrix sp.]